MHLRKVNYFLEILDLTYPNCTKVFDAVPHVKLATIIREMRRKTVHC